MLVSAIDTTRENHKKAFFLIEKIKEKKFHGFISTQIIGEFYVTLTRSLGGIKAESILKRALVLASDYFSLMIGGEAYA